MFCHLFQSISLSFDICINWGGEDILGSVQLLFRNQVLESFELFKCTLNNLSALKNHIIFTCWCGPPTVRPKRPWSMKCSLIKDAFYTQGTLLSKFLVHLECMPLPGPPDENEEALPNKTLKILYNSIRVSL